MIKDWEKAVDDIKKITYEAEKLYKNLIEIRPENSDLIVCPEHLGDTIWVAAYAKAYVKEHDCDFVYYVVKESQSELTMCFPDVSGVIALTDKEMLCLRWYMIVMGFWNENHIRYGHFREVIEYDSDKNYFFLTQRGHGKSMSDERKIFLGIEGTGSRPSGIAAIDNGDDVELKKAFNKAVLLIPSAQSEISITDVFWQILADCYKKMGYEVYTNYNGLHYEQKVEGTKHISSSIKELAVMAPYFTQVIALRSGACDLLALTDTNLSVIYNSELPDRDVVLKRGDVKWDSIDEITEGDRLFFYQYLQGKDEELIKALIKQSSDNK